MSKSSDEDREDETHQAEIAEAQRRWQQIQNGEATTRPLDIDAMILEGLKNPEYADEWLKGHKEEIASLTSEIDRLRAALERCLIGGNHLANYLIGRLGARFVDDYPVGSKHGDIRAAFGPSNNDDYEVWCCWNAIMQARAISERDTRPKDGDHLGAPLASSPVCEANSPNFSRSGD